MKSYARRWILAMSFLLMAVTALHMMIAERSAVSLLKKDTCMETPFRVQHLKPELFESIKVRASSEEELSQMLACTMLGGSFMPERIMTDSTPYLKYKPEEFRLLEAAYLAVWGDLACFPIPDRKISYEDTFGAPRGYGGERNHEGTDLFGEIDEPGYYPILSITDGVVENIGWLPLGGYRIGIRAPHGGYFYYAHLSRYEREFSQGDRIYAGDLIGYMGNTGYGPEGTKGQFPVHLHLGIYIATPYEEEVSVNPYWVLRSLGKNIRKYSY